MHKWPHVFPTPWILQGSRSNLLRIGRSIFGILAVRVFTGLCRCVVWPLTTCHHSVIRAVVTAEGNWEDVVLNSYDKLFKHGKAGELVVGVVDRLDDDRAYLTDGGSLSYDWLVLATGNTWDGPLKLPVDRENTRVWLEGWHEKFANARNVVIIGAGSAGIGEQTREFIAW